MTFTLLYFARLRDELKIDQEAFEPAQALDTLEQLRQQLADRGPNWQQALYGKGVFAAVNQDIADWNTPLKGCEEVAFFPPVTGG